MILALLCKAIFDTGNIFYSFLHTINDFSYFESFFYGCYFLLIVYYVGLKLIRAWQNILRKKTASWIAHLLFSINAIFLIAILI